MPETKQPLVSIIVPVYNAASHIARCIESIRRQTYQNIEIILLNDGSKDVSLQVCEMYAKIDRRIILLDRTAVRTAFAGDPALALEMLRYVSGTVRQLSDQLDHMTFLRADQRVARYLLSIPADGPALHLTQDDLANAVGLSRVTVCRALKSLSEQGLLETHYGSIRLLDRAGLEAL